MRSPPTLVNLWAGPGTGKSTTAAGLFNLMKHAGHKVELVTERAKFFTYERNIRRLDDPFYMMVNQEYCQQVLVGQVDYIITDSPPPMVMAYADQSKLNEYAVLTEMAYHFHGRYDTVDILLERVKPYQQYGRNQTEAEAAEVHAKVRQLWDMCAWDNPRKATLQADADAPYIIYDRYVRPYL